MTDIELNPDELMQQIGTATYRNAFEYGLDHIDSRRNMVAYCEEFFDMNDSNDVWQMTDVCIKQINQTRKALNVGI